QSSALAGSVAERQLPKGNVVLSWRDLRRDFAGLVAVTDFSFELKSGEVVALVGPNGSGKSTTINVLTGIYAPTAGQVILKGEDVSGLPSHAIAKKGLVRTFQDPRLVGRFTVLENVLLGAHLHFGYGLAEAASGLGRTSTDEREAVSRADAVIELMGLTDKRDQIVETLPYGYRRLVEVARAMMVEPEVVLLDEPAAGLSEGEIQRLEQVIRNMCAQGVAVLIVDHHMDFLAGHVDSVVVLDGGIEIFRGDMDSMRRDETVIECYLGKFEKPDA
ncbi:MAG: ABC transporter ATP-binding protein, partial [Fimbriimonadaceae bacterium]|nr:ABC transporter ATP-binding protein [Alphaproteobacteria bacterium]